MPTTEKRPVAPSPRVLVVDDDRAVLESMKEWLELRCGAEVFAFASAEELMATSLPGTIDVCVLDYRLEGANGLTLGAMLREINPDTQLILVTGDISPRVRSLALEHGFGRVFAKPVSPERLAEAVEH